MSVVIIAMLVILVIAAGVIAVVVMGIEGTGSDQHPEIADAMARTARHLSGDAGPPQGLRVLARELDEVAMPSLKAIPHKVRSAFSASSAASATAPEADEETTDAVTWTPPVQGWDADAAQPDADSDATQVIPAAVDGVPSGMPTFESDAVVFGESSAAAEAKSTDEADGASAADEVIGAEAVTDEVVADDDPAETEPDVVVEGPDADADTAPESDEPPADDGEAPEGSDLDDQTRLPQAT